MSIVTGELSIDLVVATVDREAELARLLDSLDAQTYRRFRVLVADQNEDDRVLRVCEGRSFAVERLSAPRGLSRARNEALGRLSGDLVAFPDDDCRYPPRLLEAAVDRFTANPGWDGVTGRTVDADGLPLAGSWDAEGGPLNLGNVWFRGVSCTIFLRTALVRRLGEFDPRLGLGSGRGSASGEETEYLVRAVRRGATIVYDPSLQVEHDPYAYDDAALAAIGLRDGLSLGYILRKHSFPPTEVARRLLRPAGGALLWLVRGDRRRARFHAATFRGRILGYAGRPIAEPLASGRPRRVPR